VKKVHHRYSLVVLKKANFARQALSASPTFELPGASDLTIVIGQCSSKICQHHPRQIYIGHDSSHDVEVNHGYSARRAQKFVVQGERATIANMIYIYKSISCQKVSTRKSRLSTRDKRELSNPEPLNIYLSPTSLRCWSSSWHDWWPRWKRSCYWCSVDRY
jgi:hypothetical protein